MSTTTIAKSSQKEIDQRFINAIEKRLSLKGGSTPREFGADLSLRYGKTKPILEEIDILKSVTMGVKIHEESVLFKKAFNIAKKYNKNDSNIRTDKGLRIFLNETIVLLKEKKTELVGKEIHELTKTSIGYITNVYGKELRDQYGKLTGYGDRIEVRRGHLIKLY